MTGGDPEGDGLAGFSVAGAVQQLGAVEPVAGAVRLDPTQPGMVVVLGYHSGDAAQRRRAHWLTCSVDDLGDWELDQVGGSGILQRRNQDVDIGFGNNRFHRVTITAKELGDRGRFQGGKHGDHIG